MRLPPIKVIYSEPARQAGSFDASLVKIASTELKPIFSEVTVRFNEILSS